MASGDYSTARVIWVFTPGVPGLLQTEDFARVVLSGGQTTADGDEAVEEQVAARLGRQYVVRQKPQPEVRIIMDEFALRRPAAPSTAWHDQLLHLETAATWPNVALQVLPFSAGAHHHMTGSLTLLWQRDGTAVAYKEGNGCSRLIEDPDEVLRQRLSYDRLTFIRDVLEEHRS